MFPIYRKALPTALAMTCAVVLLIYPWVISRPNSVVHADEKVRIDSPLDGASVTGRIDIRVTVATADPDQLDFYRIYVGNGRTPSAMRPLGPPRTEPAENEVMATLDTTLLETGEATIQLRMYAKNGDRVDAAVVVTVPVGPTPTRTFAGPVIVVPEIAVPSAQVVAGSQPPGMEYPIQTTLDVQVPQFAPIQSTPIPIQRLTPDYIYDTLPGDPVQTDQVMRDVQILPPSLPTPNLVPIPR